MRGKAIRWIRNIKIKYQLILLIVIAIIIILMIQQLYIGSFSQAMEKKAFEYFNSVTVQVSNGINASITEIKNTSSTLSFSYNLQNYILSENSYSRLQHLKPALDNLNYSIASNSNIDSIRVIIYDTDLSLYAGSTEKEYLCKAIYDEYHIGENKNRKPFFTHVYLDKVTKKYYFAYVTPIYSVLDGYFRKEPIGALILLCNARIYKNIDDIHNYSGLSLFLSDRASVIAYKSDSEQDPNIRLLKEKDMSVDGDYKITVQKEPFLVKVKTIQETGFKLYCIIPVKELLKDMKAITSKSVVIVLLGTALMALLGSAIIRNIIKPINKILWEMGRVGTDGKTKRITKHADNEVGIIADDINEMLEKIETMNKRVFSTQQKLYELELARVQTELSNLYNQINPHFLYNSLECIRSIAISNRQMEIVSISVALSRIFRYSVKSDYNVSLGSELDLVSDYFSVINTRYMEIYRLNIVMDPALRNFKVIKMILQPIVENTINHGFKGKRKNGRIRIKSYLDRQEKALFIRITDNGIGMDRETCRDIRAVLAAWREDSGMNKRIGLVNIHKRLKMTYGSSSGLKIFSRPNTGTCISIRIPAAGNETFQPPAGPGTDIL